VQLFQSTPTASAHALTLHADYKTALNAVPEDDGKARHQALHACHQRSADKLLKLCFDNGGIYIKLGQHIGQLVRLQTQH
jgi:aarF domain-containing kinase